MELREIVNPARRLLCHTDGMSEVGARGGSRRGVPEAIADRQRGRSRLTATTVTAGVASLAVAGVVAVGLPGPASSATVTTPGTGTGTGTSDQENQGTPGGLTPPAYTPAPASGGGGAVSTSGGTHS